MYNTRDHIRGSVSHPKVPSWIDPPSTGADEETNPGSRTVHCPPLALAPPPPLEVKAVTQDSLDRLTTILRKGARPPPMTPSRVIDRLSFPPITHQLPTAAGFLEPSPPLLLGDLSLHHPVWCDAVMSPHEHFLTSLLPY